ncbi:MAG: PIG-L family deacetylase [Candidatus Omnitrophica bacterium]|nr:PIG-L family deacetylase [Candidatus Omnitrophota bacterium]
MNILAFGAHPDDIELGCAGTLLKYAKQGSNVYLCVLSSGSEAGDAVTREHEQEEAAKKLGVKELIWGHCEDTKISVNKNNISFIESVLQKIKPDEVYVNYYDDTHQDHRALAQCVISATRYTQRVIYYEDYTSNNFIPDIFVDIGEIIEEKIRIIESFKSQISRSFPSELNMIESIRAVAHFRGFQGRTKYAEGFKALRYLKHLE